MNTVWVDLLGAEVRYYRAGDIRTRCIESGEGPPVIFLHGVGGHAEAFARNIVPLGASFRAMAIDYLGFGLTDKPSASAGRDDYVRHLLDFMDAAGLKKAHLVGESLGGWIAMWTALLHPDRVDKLVSVCGARLDVATDAESQRHLDKGRAELQRLTRQFVDDPSRENVQRRMAWLFHDPDRDLSDELIDIRWSIYQQREAQRTLRESGQRVIEGRGGGGDPELAPAQLAQLKHETLMLWTSHNPTTTAATAEHATSHLPSGRFELMRACGHWPQWEDPETFNRIVTEFLAG